MAMLKRLVGQEEFILTDVEKARAIGDRVRATILQILSKREASIAELKTELESQGIRIAPTTIRHHVNLLKKADLIELARLEEARGGVLKYYASKVRLMEHKAPEDFDYRLGSAVEEAAADMLKLTKKLLEKHGRKIRQVAKSLKPCPYCSEEHFLEYVLLEIINRAVARTAREKEFRELLK